MKVLLIFLFLYSIGIFSQKYIEPEYKLLDKFENADLNYKSIDSINSKTGGITMLDSVFNVITGKYTVYRFMTFDRGTLFFEYISDLNDLIILKVDSTNTIVDGYKYFLQAPEMPSTCWLYKLSKKKKIKDKIKINSLKFKRVQDTIMFNGEVFDDVCYGASKYLKDSKILDFNATPIGIDSINKREGEFIKDENEERPQKKKN